MRATSAIRFPLSVISCQPPAISCRLFPVGHLA